MGNQNGKKVIEFAGDFWTMERLVGTGAFGKVYAIMNKEERIFAMKMLDKRLLLTKSSLPGTMRERHFLTELSHPFIVNLNGALQNHTHLLMILDFMSGGDIEFHLQAARSNRFEEDQARFYAYNLLLALEYLHEHNIVHRDIKADNVMLDGEGYAHLTDFNVAKQLDKRSDGKPPTTTGYAGTFLYMAPEIFEPKGFEYGSEVDIWSLGVLIYVMLRGNYPWKTDMSQSTEEHMEATKKQVFERVDPKDTKRMEVVRRISRAKVTLPSKYFSDEAKAVLEFMLCPGERRKTATDLLKMQWFKSLDRDAIMAKKAKTPFTPPDKANVDPSLHIEDVFAIKQKIEPLTDQEQKQFARWNWVRPSHDKRAGTTTAKQKKRSLLRGSAQLDALFSTLSDQEKIDLDPSGMPSNLTLTTNNTSAAAASSSAASSSSSLAPSSSKKKHSKRKSSKKIQHPDSSTSD